MKKILYFMGFLWLGSAQLKAAEPSVIAREGLVENNFTQSELINIFTRKRIFWPDGHKISVFIKPINSIEHKIFTINILNITPYRYKSMADSIVYSGYNNPPVEIQSDDEMILRVSSTPYSIGYLNYKIIANNSEEIITIRVQ